MSQIEKIWRVLNAANEAEIISEGMFEEAEKQLDELANKAQLFDAIKWNTEQDGFMGSQFERAAKATLEKYKARQNSESIIDEIHKRIEDEGAMGRARAEKYCNQKGERP